MNNNGSKLAFESIEFAGIKIIDPPFNPNVKEYTIHRKAGSDFRFKAKLNRPPTQQTEDDGTMYRPYGSYSLTYSDDDSSRKGWFPECWHGIDCSAGESRASISCSLSKRYQGNEEPFYVILNVVTEEMQPEERLACKHISTITSEGEFWGGGSGSCTVEMNTRCVACGYTLSTSYDHRS